MRLLFICVFSLCCSWATAQKNELDAEYTPPSKAKFSQSKGMRTNTGLLSRASEAPFLWAVKYDVTKTLKNHYQLGFEKSVTDWFSFEPMLGVLTNKLDMYPGANQNYPFLQELTLNVDRQPLSALNYPSLLNLSVPRNNAILSLGIQANLYSNGDRSFEDMAYTLQIGYQFQHMAYSLGDTVNGNAFMADSREGFVRRQQITVFAGGQMALGDRLPFIIEYGLLASFNLLTAPTFDSTPMPNLPFNFTYQELTYATAMIPTLGFRVKVGMGFNPQ